MKAFKGFNKDMTCRGFQFKEGETYHEDKAKLCDSGFHACEDPLDCIGYYAPAGSIYREVELDDVTDEYEEDSKRVGKTIKIGAEIGLPGIIKAHFEHVKSRCTNEKEGGDRSALTGGDRSALTGGDSSALTGGDRSALTGGYRSALTGGISSVLRGGVNSRFKGDIYSFFICDEWKYDVKLKRDFYVPIAHAFVDGEKIKPDTWYTVKDGEYVEVPE